MGASVKRKDKKHKTKAKKKNVDQYPESKNPFAEDENKIKNKFKKFTKTKSKKNQLIGTSEPLNNEVNAFQNVPQTSPVVSKTKDATIKSPPQYRVKNGQENNLLSSRNTNHVNSTKPTTVKSQITVEDKIDNNNLSVIEDDGKSKSLRLYRSASVSKKKNKKVRIKKLTRRLNKNKKNKQKPLEIPVENAKVVRRETITKKPTVQPSINELQTEVEQVTEVARNSLYLVAQERQNELDTLLLKTSDLNEKSMQFHQVSKQTKEKQKKSASFCGLRSTFSACFSKCACGNRIRKKRENTNGKTDEERIIEIEDRYQRIKPKNTSVDKLKNENNYMFAPMTPTSSNNSSVRDSTTSLNLSRKGPLKALGVGNSLPQINIVSPKSLSQLVRRDRKYSSTSALDKPMSEKKLRKEKEKSEHSIKEYTEQFEDEEMRKRATSLLRLDHNIH